MLKRYSEYIKENLINYKENSYLEDVLWKLKYILMEERQISEKSFNLLDELDIEVETIYLENKEYIDEQSYIGEKNKFRHNYIAEVLFQELFNNNILEKKDFENITKPTKLKKKLTGVSLGKSKSGKYFVYTHRARCKYYDNIEDIPQKDIDFIRSTG